MNTLREIQRIDTGALKKFAQAARRQLREQVAAQLDRVLKSDSAELREKEAAIKELKNQIAMSSREAVIDRVAYTWFNRFCALRFMDANRYTRMGTVSPADGFTQPEVLSEAKQGHIEESLNTFINKQRIFDLLGGHITSTDPQQEAYRLLVVAVCNYYNSIMPFLFERIADYTELLMPDDLLSENSVLSAVRETLTPQACGDVEVIGWLYQFYISEKKDQVFADLKKNKRISPENIPAATQLFTPHWIVRFLVENSLGRLWMLNKPESRLKERMKYYIKPEQLETEFLHISKPEALKICDPACGSGHMLVYAFDLLYAIYEEEGYEPTEIPRLILENNLYGIEIDERAGELAAFALAMKARDKHKRYFNKPTQPNICVLENVIFDEGELGHYLDAIGQNVFTANLQQTLRQFSESNNFGSLIRPTSTDVTAIVEQLETKNVAGNVFLHKTHEKVLQAVRCADYLSPKYDVVIANPPYMGGKGMNSRLKEFADETFPKSKSDLFAMFLERGFEMTRKSGYTAMVTMESWMFLSSYEDMRKDILDRQTIESMVHMPYLGKGGTSMGISFGTCATVFRKLSKPGAKGNFSYVRYFETDDNGVPLEFPVKNERLALATADEFKQVPGSPIAYWISEAVRKTFESKLIRDVGECKNGMTTGNNDLFLRYWHEVSLTKICFDSPSREAVPKENSCWVPYSKGGVFRKWFGNNELVIDWSNDGNKLFSNKPKTIIRNHKYYFQEAITWSLTSSANFGARIRGSGFVFDVNGMSGFFGKNNINILCLLNSKVASSVLKIINPTMAFQSGDIERIPFKSLNVSGSLSNNGMSLIDLSKSDWDSYETSWDFKVSPLMPTNWDSKLSEAYRHLRENWDQAVRKARILEEENNGILIEAYGLKDELAPEVPLGEITLNCNPNYSYGSGRADQELEEMLLADTMKELISFSVGCMFGRYSIDKPGLILANQGDTKEDYLTQIPNPRFQIEEDGVIPILDDDWFSDDISERFRKFLRVGFGDKHYEENVQFIEKAIGKDIRKYFVKDFYIDHTRHYKKRPIYWLFSSPKGTFNALIYMHRYRPDTVSVILNDYLREFRNKLSARKSHLESVTVSASVSPAEKARALKDIETLKKDIDELDTYERDVLYPLATEKVQINLDNGVKVNYSKFGKALKTIPGMASEEDET